MTTVEELTHEADCSSGDFAMLMRQAASELSALQKENDLLRQHVVSESWQATIDERDSLLTQNRELREALELAQRRHRLIYAKNVDEIKTLPTPYDKALALQPEK